MLKWLAKNHDVTVVGFRDPELEEQDAFLDFIPREKCHLLSEPGLMKMGDFFELRFLPRWCLSYFSPELQKLIDRLVQSGNYDRVHISHSYMAFYLLHHVETISCLIDHHNVKSLFFENASRCTKNPKKRIAYQAEKVRWQYYEQEVLPRFNEHISCSETEQDLLRAITGKQIHLVPSGVDTQGFRRKSEPFIGTNLLFTGSLDYFPNAQAIEFFCKACLPAIRDAIPPVKLQVVGKNPTLRTERLLEKTENTWSSYNVRDIRPFYYQSTVFVVPLLTGAGTRLKIMEAMAIGLPVVSTGKGCEGLGLESGQGILIEDDPGAMAAAVIRLLEDDGYRESMSRTAFEVCQERFSWKQIFSQAEFKQIYA